MFVTQNKLPLFFLGVKLSTIFKRAFCHNCCPTIVAESYRIWGVIINDGTQIHVVRFATIWNCAFLSVITNHLILKGPYCMIMHFKYKSHSFPWGWFTARWATQGLSGQSSCLVAVGPLG